MGAKARLIGERVAACVAVHDSGIHGPPPAGIIRVEERKCSDTIEACGQPSGQERASLEGPGRLLPVGFFHPLTRLVRFRVAGIHRHYGLVFLDREIAILELIVHFSGSEIGLLE